MISVKAELARRNCKYASAAKKIGMPTSTFYKKLSANSFSVEEAEKIFSSIGVKMVLASK